MRRLGSALAVVGLALAACACGIPTDSQATPIPAHQVPFHLLAPTIRTSTTTTSPVVAYVGERIFLLTADQKLLPVRRDVAVPASLEGVLDALLDGPTARESALGITTALPSTVRVLSVQVAGHVATLDLNPAFGAISSSAETQAVAQIVLTTTIQPGISGVRFKIGGRQIAVPTASGVSTKGAVNALDYTALLTSP